MGLGRGEFVRDLRGGKLFPEAQLPRGLLFGGTDSLPCQMKRIESCPSIVDSVSFFDNDANIADSFHADLAPLPARPHDAGLHLHSGALPRFPSRFPRA